MLGYINQLIEKSEFGTGLLEQEDVLTHAVMSVFLGARIHDAAVMTNQTDRKMRDAFLQYCKHANPEVYEQIGVRAGNMGYTTPPLEFFQPHIRDFFELPDLSASDIAAAKQHASDYLDRVKKELALARLSCCVLDGVIRNTR